MKKNTGRALLMSFLSLFLCVTMLLGTTFAWFTDEVTSTNNIIKSGTLDVDLEYKNSVTTVWKGVDADTNVFLSNLWEPGHTEVVKLKVTNLGDLALKYNLGINIADEVKSVSINGTPLKLSEHIMFGIYEGDLDAERDAAIEAVKANATPLSEKATKLGTIVNQNDSKVYTLVVYMPTTVGNEANAAVDAAKPTINLGINLLATQLVAESDSFGPEYDEDAEILPPAWDGEGDDLPAEVDNVITINTAGELKAFADAVNGTSTISLMATTATGNSFSGKTVKLGADINLNGIAWTPIGAANTPAYFQGTFDGQGHTIYGLNVDNSADGYMYSTSGLFGWIDAGAATIKNVNISGATVKGSHWVGGVVGYMTGTIENCHVTNSTIAGYNVNDDANGDKVGGIVGYVNTGKGSLNGNSVTDSTIIGYRDVAGIAGAVATTNSVKNNKVENVTVIAEADYVGEIVSAKTAVVVDDTNTAENVTTYRGAVVADGVLKTGEKSFSVTSKEGLINLEEVLTAAAPGEGRGVTVDLLTDVDLAGEEWDTIDTMWITFNGNDHTISNLTSSGRRAGFYGYAGAVTINDLTIENANITGSQAGIFAGSGEALKTNNCFIKGNNTVTFAPTEETWNGIGAVTGVLISSNVNVTIAKGATVLVDYNTMTTAEDEGCKPIDEFTGYISANNGTVVNNGKITVLRSATASTAAELQSVLDTALDGTVITLTADITSDTPVVVNQPGDKEISLVIDGGNHKYDGQIKIKGNSSNGKESLVIKNINFESSTQSQDFIWCADSSNGSVWRYAHNVTIENCTFTASGDAVNTAVGARFQQCYNIAMNNCTGTNLHSLLQAESCGSTVKVEGSKVINGKNGISLNNTMNAIVKNCEIESVVDGGYGIRHKGQELNYALTVENCKVSAFVPVLIRNMTGNGYTADFLGTNTLTATNKFGYDVVLSAGDWDNDANEPSAPTGTYTITGADSFTVFEG